MIARLLVCAVPLPLLSGCLAAEIITAPIDAVTTTQSEADEDRGKAMRKRDKKMGALIRRREDAREDCRDGQQSRCADADKLEQEIAELEDKPLDY